MSKNIFLLLLGYAPLHIFLSTFIGTNLDILAAAKIAKDILLCIGFVLVLIATVRQPFFKALLRQRLAWLILAYAALNIVLAIVRPTDGDAEFLGLVYNTRFLLFFVYGVLLVNLFKATDLRRQAMRVVLLAGAVVVMFGAMQYMILPDSVMIRAGYSRENGVLPAFYIDDKPDLERIMSTLRDPNSLGSYLIILISLLLSLVVLLRPKKKTMLIGSYLLLAGLCLFWTFSRSAWLGMAAAIMVMVAFTARKQMIKLPWKRMALFGLGALVVFCLGAYFQRDSYLVQNIVFHADESTTLEDPNELRVRFWRESVGRVVDQPLGSGPGTAGLASIRNEAQGVNLNENYYLQVAQETGVLGISLFIIVLAAAARRLIAAFAGSPVLALALLGSLAGLCLTNFLVHIWSNEAVAYTWWGLAALTVGRIATTQKRRLV